ncbi:MAG: hypothetical protein QM504_07810 [Pseudomonadota bacterium]
MKHEFKLQDVDGVFSLKKLSLDFKRRLDAAHDAHVPDLITAIVKKHTKNMPDKEAAYMISCTVIINGYIKLSGRSNLLSMCKLKWSWYHNYDG